MNPFSLGAFVAALGIGLGAFGAHALRHLPADRLAWWSTATQYLFIAAFGILFAGLRGSTDGRSWGVPGMFLAGVVLFSGSLYAMALGAPRWFGAITPLGGLSLIGAFVWLGVSAYSAAK